MRRHSDYAGDAEQRVEPGGRGSRTGEPISPYAIYAKRGSEATDAVSILSDFTGVSLYDGWRSGRTRCWASGPSQGDLTIPFACRRGYLATRHKHGQVLLATLCHPRNGLHWPAARS